MLAADGGADAVVSRLAAPATRLVSLTITEKGYYMDSLTGDIDRADPMIQHDIEGTTPPRTALGIILAALQLRRERGLEPFTVMSCDNIQGNGHITRRLLCGLARHMADYTVEMAGLAEWIERQGAFPNSMVDRITPATTAKDVAEVESECGWADAVPVIAEPFRQWVRVRSVSPIKSNYRCKLEGVVKDERKACGRPGRNTLSDTPLTSKILASLYL